MNDFAISGRRDKAFRLAGILRKAGVTSRETAKFLNEDWACIAVANRMKWDTSREHPETVAEIRRMLAGMEATGEELGLCQPVVAVLDGQMRDEVQV